MTKQRKQAIIAAFCSVLAAAAVFAYTSSVRAEALGQRDAAVEHYGGEVCQVVVAKTDIEAGTALSAENAECVNWVVDLLPSGDVAQSFDEVSGSIAQVNIKKNEPILLERVGDGSSRLSVPDGLEAVTVSSDDVLAVGGAISAGSLVDVYVETSKGKVVLLGQKVLVLETNGGEASLGSSGEVSWVTLAVTPESVNELLQASVKGTIHFVLPSSSLQKDE